MAIISGGAVIEGAISRSSRRAAVFEYDFAVDGGAVGAINMRPVTSSQSPVPSAAIIDNATIEVLTVPTSAGAATISVGVEAAGDVQAAAAISGAPWSTVGRKNGTPQSGATSVKTTAARTPSITVGTAALTAGKLRLLIDYIDPAV